jgi:hypothetical protein
MSEWRMQDGLRADSCCILRRTVVIPNRANRQEALSGAPLVLLNLVTLIWYHKYLSLSHHNVANVAAERNKRFVVPSELGRPSQDGATIRPVLKDLSHKVRFSSRLAIVFSATGRGLGSRYGTGQCYRNRRTHKVASAVRAQGPPPASYATPSASPCSR